MHTLQRQKTASLLDSQKIDYALFSSLESVKWLTGFAPPIHLGTNIFVGGPALVWYEKHHFTLIVLDVHQTYAPPPQSDYDVVTYEGYTIQEPIESGRNLGAALQKFIPPAPRKIGIESASITHLIQNMFAAETEFARIDQWLEPMRAIKTPEEIAKLRRNFELVELGHQIARATVAPGLREIDVWMAIHSAINQATGEIVPLGNDCVVSSRQQNIGGLPLDFVIHPQDTLTVDLSTIHQGYWSDSCMSYFASDPTPQQLAVRQVVQDALEYGISLVKPGVMAREIDQKVRHFIERAGLPVYPHHTGHGVGVSGHEAPRIVPYSEEILQAGMVIMLEPGVYIPGELSIRLEDALLITADGVEILTHHDKSGLRLQ